MRLASWVALILVSAAAAISSLLAAVGSLFSSIAFGSAGNRGPLSWHVNFIAIALSVAFAGVSILSLKRPTQPSLLGSKLAVSCFVAAVTTACEAFDLCLHTRILGGESGIWSYMFDPGPVYPPLIMTALTLVQWSICFKQLKQQRAYLASEKVLKEQQIAAGAQASGSWPPPPKA
jgi:hypothetical protein